jgi:hypothetical protein
VPFVIATSYDASIIPERYRGGPLREAGKRPLKIAKALFR